MFSWPSPVPMAVCGFIVAVGGWLRVAPGVVGLPPQATAATATAASKPRKRRLIDFLPPLIEHECVLLCPGQPHRPADELLCVAEGVHILTYRHELLAPVQVDDVAGGHAHVDHLFDGAGLD